MKKKIPKRSVKCPHCDAGPGKPCRGADGYPVKKPHEARRAKEGLLIVSPLGCGSGMTTRKPTTKKRKGLNFEYCECGCHGLSASAGTVHFWIYWDLDEHFTGFKLHQGHGFTSLRIGTFDTLSKAEAAATKLARLALKKMQKDLGV